MSVESRPTAEQWLSTRRILRESRLELSRIAASCYEDVHRVGTTSLLTKASWLPAVPLPLMEANLLWSTESVDNKELVDIAARHLPEHEGKPYNTYVDAVLDLDPPALLEDRPCYRLVGAAMPGAGMQLTFGAGTYFDVLNIGEAAAHELASTVVDNESAPSLENLPLRAAIGDPTDPGRRPMLTAITALTIRHDRDTNRATFFVHWRDPAKVAMNGGYYQVTPVGMFQPAGTPVNGDGIGDFDLWRCLSREYGEEFLGVAELHDVDYEGWSFYQELRIAQAGGTCQPYFLGIGTDPLSLATDILTAVVFDAHEFDRMFAEIIEVNSEGQTDVQGTAFTSEHVERLVRIEKMQPAGAATLELAWKHRQYLLGV